MRSIQSWDRVLPYSAYVIYAAILMSLSSLPCLAQSSSSTKNQFTNGLSGTPNLPTSLLAISDKTAMAGNILHASEIPQDFHTGIVQLNQSVQSFPKTGDHTRIQRAFRGIQRNVSAFYAKLQADLPVDSLFYSGAQLRAGQGAPLVIFPELLYSNVKFGGDIGFQDFSGRFRGAGFSFKYDLSGMHRRLSDDYDELNSVVSLYLLFGRLIHDEIDAAAAKSSVSDWQTAVTTLGTQLEPFLNANTPDAPQQMLRTMLNALSVNAAPEGSDEPPISFSGVVAKASKDYIDQLKKPTPAAIVGYRSVDNVGTITDYGVSLSALIPLHQSNAPSGITPLIVAEEFLFRPEGRPSQSGARIGVGVIWQDRVPTLANYTDPDEQTTYKRIQGTWQVKLGFEYISPTLGTKGSEDTFVRYRHPRKYWEITVSAGKDSADRGFVGISVGQNRKF